MEEHRVIFVSFGDPYDRSHAPTMFAGRTPRAVCRGMANQMRHIEEDLSHDEIGREFYARLDEHQDPWKLAREWNEFGLDGRVEVVWGSFFEDASGSR